MIKNNIDKKNGFDVPILFIIFNRPKYTEQVFAEIKKIKPKKLFIVADGPRFPSEIELCNEAKKIVENIDWDCEVKKNFSEKNLGLKKRISSGITWFFENVEEGIILEDDCLPHPTFFDYCKMMLEKYRDNNNVMMISGDNPIQDTYNANCSYFFSRYYAIWGWATWKRAWDKFDIKMKKWPEYRKTNLLKHYYKNKYALKHFKEIFDNSYYRNEDTWGVRWFYSCLFNNGLCVTPSVNLISNIGVDGSHTAGNNQNISLKKFDSENITHPDIITVNEKFDELLYDRNFRGSRKKIFKHFYNFTLSTLAKSGFAKRTYRFLARQKNKLFGFGFYENVNKTNYTKNCLLLYIIEPFRIDKINYRHQNYEQVKTLASLISELGYNVDVVNFNDYKVKLKKNYNLVIDIHPGLNNIYKNHQAKDCKIIYYSTGADPLFLIQEEKKRLDYLYKRKNVKLGPKRSIQAVPKQIFSSLNGMLHMGNELNLKTYDSYNIKKKYLINNTGYTFLNSYDFSKKSPKNFLFFAGSGQVHKGLDLLLEIFTKHDDLHLYICSPFEKEKDFVKLYKKELYETKNIHPVGSININSFEFLNIVRICSYILHPSCSEGQSGSVLIGMSAGLIPIITKICGLKDDEAIYIDDVSTNNLEKILLNYSQKNLDWIKNESQKYMKIANDNYNIEKFKSSVRYGLKQILEN